MNEQQAQVLADLFGGSCWQPSPGFWQVVLTRDDGALVVFDNETIAEYVDEFDYETGDTLNEIRLN